MATRYPEPVAEEWVSFPGGELEGKRPKALCPACREALKRAAFVSQTRRDRAGQTPASNAAASRRAPRTLCFACYRAELDRQRAIAAAGQLDTATESRFQYQLPFEPVNEPRLAMLKADWIAARAQQRVAPIAPFADKRRHAQIEARHALQQIAAGLKARTAKAERDRAMASAFHAVELQLPDSWIPFVMAR